MVFVWNVSFFSCARSYFKTFAKWHVSTLYIPFEHPYCSIYSIVISLCTCKAYILYSFVHNLTDPKRLAIEVNVLIHVNYIAILDPPWGLNLLSRGHELYKFCNEFYECHNHACSFADICGSTEEYFWKYGLFWPCTWHSLRRRVMNFTISIPLI